MSFREGKLTEEATWQAVVLIPKGMKDYRGIGLVEVMWNVVAAILNRRFAAANTYHDFLHGFQAGHGTGTATLKAASFCNSLASRVTVPVPRPALKPWSKSWKVKDSVSR